MLRIFSVCSDVLARYKGGYQKCYRLPGTYSEEISTLGVFFWVSKFYMLKILHFKFNYWLEWPL